MCYDGEQQREGSAKRMQKWVSVWGNAVSIAENRPERYAKEITLRYGCLAVSWQRRAPDVR